MLRECLLGTAALLQAPGRYRGLCGWHRLTHLLDGHVHQPQTQVNGYTAGAQGVIADILQGARVAGDHMLYGLYARAPGRAKGAGTCLQGERVRALRVHTARLARTAIGLGIRINGL